MKKLFKTKNDVLLVLVAAMGVVSVLMNTFAGLRPFYTEGAHGVWRAVSFSTLVVSWFPLLIGDILADRYSKKVAFGIPAFIFALQALIFALAIPAGYTGEGWQNLWAGIAGNYAGLIANLFVFLTLKKLIGTDKWHTLMIVAIVSTVFGQLFDNTLYMMLSPFQWAGNVLEGGNFIGFATQWETVNKLGVNEEWTGKVATLGWDSMFLKSAFEIGVEMLVYPLTLVLIKGIKTLQDNE